MPTCVLICIRDRPIIRSDINHYSSSLLSVCSKANTVSPVTQVIASQHRMIWMYWGWWYTCCWTTRPRRQPPSCWHTACILRVLMKDAITWHALGCVIVSPALADRTTPHCSYCSCANCSLCDVCRRGRAQTTLEPTLLSDFTKEDVVTD